MDTENLFTVDEAAGMLNISVIQAWRWIRSGKLKTTKVFSRTLISKGAIAAVTEPVKIK